MDEEEIKPIYQGGYSSISPPKDLTVESGSLGLTTDARTANILKEVSSKLATGVKQIELEFVSPEVFDAIPKQQLKEVNRLSKLTGVGLSVHGPVVDTTGMTQQGFSELNREASERRLIEVINRSHELNPDGNIPVTFHSAEGIPGTEFEITKEGDEKVKKMIKMIAINRESGKMAPLETEEKFYPGGEIRKRIYEPTKQLKVLNDTEWDNTNAPAIFNKESADRILKEVPPIVGELLMGLETKQIKPEMLTQDQIDIVSRAQNAKEYLDQSKLVLNAQFTKAYKYGTPKQREHLNELSKKYGKMIGVEGERQDMAKAFDLKNQSRALQLLSNGLQEEGVNPNMYVQVEDFASDQSAKTFGNVAFESFKKFGDKAPIVSIENPPAGFALSKGEELKDVVEKSRKQFVKIAVEKGELSESEAKIQAEKLIGVTWDVGHINMLRKHGYEKKDIIKETEAIAPLLKHVHLSDNFGFEHTELPMGMGNVPIKEIMKTLGKKGAESKKIIEAISWWQHFSPAGGPQQSPLVPTMQAMGSPIYSMQMQPYWNQSLGFQQDYSSGYGQMLPPINYETFGAGFVQLPAELGGQRQGGAGGRMSNTPME